MKRFPLYAVLLAASLAFASCGDAADDGDAMNNDTAILAPDGDMNTMSGDARDTNTIIMQDGTSGSMNADGSMQSGSGTMQGSGTMNSDGSMQGSGNMTTDGRANDSRVKEGYKNTRDDVGGAVKNGAQEVKGEYKDVRDGTDKED